VSWDYSVFVAIMIDHIMHVVSRKRTVQEDRIILIYGTLIFELRGAKQ
jgi:hypothetical protein